MIPVISQGLQVALNAYIIKFTNCTKSYDDVTAISFGLFAIRISLNNYADIIVKYSSVISNE